MVIIRRPKKTMREKKAQRKNGEKQNYWVGRETPVGQASVSEVKPNSINNNEGIKITKKYEEESKGAN